MSNIRRRLAIALAVIVGVYLCIAAAQILGTLVSFSPLVAALVCTWVLVRLARASA
jgi:hypothetical protein